MNTVFTILVEAFFAFMVFAFGAFIGLLILDKYETIAHGYYPSEEENKSIERARAKMGAVFGLIALFVYALWRLPWFRVW